MADQRLAFVRAVLDDGFSIASACRHFGISRVTGYKVLSRFDELGVDGLYDRSRAPLHRPHGVSQERIDQILALKADHATWGPKKLKYFLARLDPGAAASLPAASTFGEILKRAGLVMPRRRSRRRQIHVANALTQSSGANHVWCIDYKGQFLLSNNGGWCYPLTITDDDTRFVIRCQALTDVSSINAWPCFVGAFQEFGLPQIIRSDNGSPFARASLTGLTRLSLQFIKLGIIHEHMRPATPTQNARHERMHKTLKAEATLGPPASMPAQQTRFDTWRDCYNNERPHEGLGMRTPSDLYVASPRPYPLVMPSLEYPPSMKTLKVHASGYIKWRGKQIFVSSVLSGERVGLDRLDEQLYTVYVGTMPVAVINTADMTFLPHDQAEQRLRELQSELEQEQEGAGSNTPIPKR